jgi:drug/metabolite transporter (DMT)-like permease
VGVILGLLAAGFYGAGDFFGGWATRKDRLLAALFLIQVLGFLGSLVLLAIDHPAQVPWSDVARGMVGGSIGVCGLALLFAGMARGAVGVVAPLSAVGTALVPLLWGLAHGERPGALALVGAGAAMCGIGMVAWEPGVGDERGNVAAEAIFGAGAGLGFGTALTIFSTTSDDAGFWPLAGSRFGPVVLVGIVVCLRRVKPVSATTPWPQVGAAAAGDVGATALQFLAFREGLTSVVAPVSSLFPAFTVLLARLIYKEHITPTRVGGLLLAVGGLVLLAT